MSRIDRSAQIEGWMELFKKLHPSVKYFGEIDGVAPAKLIDSHYWELLTESIKKRMVGQGIENHIDRHKIASLYEALIAFTCPILPESGDPDDEVPHPLNFVFAYFVAQLVMSTFEMERDPGGDAERLDYFVSNEFDREHIALLSICEVGDAFVFANAAQWYLIEKYCQDRQTKAS